MTGGPAKLVVMNSSDECEILRQLKNAPELLQTVQEFKGAELALQTRLREQYEPELVRAAIALHQARTKAMANNLPAAEGLWLTGVSLQQSTAWQVAKHKAKRFPADAMVHDLCCGIGVDSAALLERGPVTSIDNDEAMLQRCRWNIEQWRSAKQITSACEWKSVPGDVTALDVSDLLVHVDPDRRTRSDRPTKRLEHYCPDLEWMQHAVQSGGSGAIKLGPASNFIGKFTGCEIELISLNGECREATVWYGDLAGEHTFRATCLPTGETIAADPLSAWCAQASDCRRFLFDPNPEIVRSGLLDCAGEIHNLQRLDRSDEYLTGDSIPDTAFVTPYLVEACLPNNLRDLKKYLNRRPSIDYEIKCRHMRTDAAAVRRKLPFGDEPRRTIVFLRIGGRARIVVAKRCKAEE